MKIFKNILFCTLGAGLLFSCEPLADTYEDLDESKTEGVTADISLTLTEDDYVIPLKYAETSGDSASMKSYKNFSDAQARKYIPYILNSKFPQLGVGSFINVSYNQFKGNSSDVSKFTSASILSVSDDDYASIAESVGIAKMFSPSYSPDDYVDGFLEDKVQDAIVGDIKGISYKYTSKDPEFDYENAGDQTVYSEGFTSDISAYSIVDVSGAQNVWTYVIYGDGAAQGSGYSGGNQNNEEWLISTEVDLSSLTEATMTMSHVTRFLSGITISDYLNVYVTDNYTGDIATTTWNTVSFPDWVDGGSSNTFVDVTADLTSFVGKKVQFAFAYKSSTAAAARWQLGEIKITTPGTVGVIAENPMTYTDYYEYSSGGSWNKVETTYSLIASDYDEMGAPGQYDNFSSSLPADDYIVTFLAGKYPYAFEEDEMVVVYKYFSSTSGSVQTRGNLYTYLNGVWNAYTTVGSASLLFAYENTSWVPDNTIKYTLIPSDYATIAANTDLGNETARANLERYGNFNTNGGYWTADDILAAINYIIKSMNPSAEEGQKYLITYDTYPGGTLEMALILEGESYVAQ